MTTEESREVDFLLACPLPLLSNVAVFTKRSYTALDWILNHIFARKPDRPKKDQGYIKILNPL